MENLRGNYNNPKTPPIKYFDGNVLPISIGRSRFRAPMPLSPIFDPYELSENPNTPNPRSPLVQCLRSGSPSPFDGSGGRGGFGSPLASIENLLTQPPRSPMTLFKTPVKVEEDVIVMDGILVKPKSGGARSRATTTTPSDSSGEKSFYKRDTCWSWEESGTCRLGSKCQFAHGLEELRPDRPTTKGNKSEICKLFHLGLCSYGTKCRFVHHQEEPENEPVNSAVLSSAAKVAYPVTLGAISATKIKRPASKGNNSTSATAIGNTGWSPQDDSIKTSLPGKASSIHSSSPGNAPIKSIHSSSPGKAPIKNIETSSPGKDPTREDVDAYIHRVLYGPSTRKRLPIFKEICPE